jgi:MSHA biogenesis protein MshQ
MLVGVSINNDRNETVTSVTYNGVNLTLVGTAEEADNARVEIWQLLAPPTGTYNVVITFDQSLQRQAIGGVMTFTGVDQFVPVGAFAGANGLSATASVNVSSAADELVFGVVAAERPASLTPGAAQTEHWNIIIGGGGRTGGAGSTQAGAGTVTPSWTLGRSESWAIGAVAIKPPSTIPRVSSATNQGFIVGDPPTVAATITITDASVAPTITAMNDIRIRIPAGFNMTWDTSVTTVTVGGGAAARVNATLLPYEDGSKTVVLDVTTGFAAGDQITIGGLQFAGFTAPSPADNLELEVNNDGVVSATDDKTITITVTLVAYYAMDELLWNGTADEVQDSSGNGNHGVRLGAAQTVDPTPPTPPVTCRAGDIPANATDTVVDAVATPVDVDANIGDSGTIDFWYKPNAAWNGGVTRTLFDGTRDTGGGDSDFFLVIEGNGRLRFELERGNGGTVRVTTSQLTFPANEWHHIAVTWAFPIGRVRIYVDGSLAAERTGDNIVILDHDTLYIGDNRTNTNGRTKNSADGVIDETYIHSVEGDATLIGADMNRSHPCAGIGHFALIHDGNGINCQAEPVTIQAHNNAHGVITSYTGTITLSTTTNRGDWSLITGGGVLDNGAPDDGAATYTFAVADSGQATLGLRDTYVETTNIDVTDGTANEDATEDPNLIFARAGFNFLAGGVSNAIGTQIAGKPSDTAPSSQVLELQAVNTNDDTGACEAALVGVNTIDLAFECEDPATCTAREVDVEGTNITGNDFGAPLSYTGVSLDFGGPADSTATFVMSYPDVGRIQLHARNILSPSGEPMLGASNAFVVRPFAFLVTAAGNPGASSPGGLVYVSAGTDFTADVSAMVWQAADDNIDNNGIADGHETTDTDPSNNADLSDNLVAPNYGQESTVEQVSLGALLDQPVGGVDPGLAGSTNVTSFVAGSGSTTVRYDDVGIIELFAFVADNDYLGIGAGETANIVGRSGYVGRFIPDRLQVVANVPDFAHTCVAGTFTYTDEAFYYGNAPVLTVTALNTAGATTNNYGGAVGPNRFWMLSTLLPGRNYTDQAGAAATFNAPLLGGTVTLSDEIDYDGDGILTMDAAMAGDDFLYQRVTPEAPFNALVDLNFPAPDLTDSDGACYDPDDNGTCDDFNINGITGTEMRFGRLVILNAFGSELLPLPVPMRTEYFVDATTGFVTNTPDTCTTLTDDYLNLVNNIDDPPLGASPATINVGAGTSTDTIGNSPMVGGDAGQSFSAPGADNAGYVDIEANLTAPAMAQPPLPWLMYDWDGVDQGGDGNIYDDHPTGRGTFGVYSGSGRHIYLRELY